MFDEAAETPTPSRRTIPPVADGATETMSPPPRTGSSWLWVLAVLWVAAMVPVGLRWYGSAGPSPAAATPPPEMNGVAIAVARNAGHITIPAAAVTDLDGKPTVFVVDRNLRLLVAMPVVLGFRSGEDREILSGVSVGDAVVADGVGQVRMMASR
jgi:multidrug efflux pump subunit AcrA (membrane-fusion protein)